ncbi:MAG: DUF6538 domain-containing protein [Limimaricola soesokkakensis]|uniref:DUF6538 domain-containing protein n=1 Tax=Limimaricola soesokkakensis TaxID=1343159 RepID=UPI004057E2A4
MRRNGTGDVTLSCHTTVQHWMTGISDGLLSMEGGMTAMNHVFRRGAVYTWRRQLPRMLVRRGALGVLQLSLQTCGSPAAKRLAAIVTSQSGAVSWAMKP